MDEKFRDSSNGGIGAPQSSATLTGFSAQPISAAQPIASQQPAAPQLPQAGPPPTKRQASRATLLRRRTMSILVIIALLLGGSIAFWQSRRGDSLLSQRSQEELQGQYDALNIPLSEFVEQGAITIDDAQTLSINGQLKVNNSLQLAPMNRPINAVAGQMYYDRDANQLAYFNGTDFVNVLGSDATVQSIGGASGALTLGTGLTLAGTQITNSGVLTVQGNAGDVTFTGGAGLVVDGTTLTNTGLLSLGGVSGDISIGRGLSVTNGALQNDGVTGLASGSSNIQITNDGNGTYTIANTGAGTGTVDSPGGTAGRIAKFTGVQTIADSLLSEAGTTVTVNGDLAVTGALSLSSLLPVSSGGTGAASFTANGVLVGQGTSAVTAVAAAGSGLCLMSTAGAPAFQACPGGGGGVTTLNGLSGALTVANATAAGSTITINNASTSQKGIAQFNSNNFSVVSGTVNTIQDIGATATPTFAGVNTNAISTTTGLTVGSSSQSLTLQGSNTILRQTNGANTASLTFVAPTANVTYRLQTAAAGTYDVCTTAGNCVGVGGGVTTPGGTTNRLAKFTGSQSVGDSLISDNGTLVTVNGNLTVTGTVSLTNALAVTSGGTGSTSAAGARGNLGAAASGANSDITSLSGLTTALSVIQGGTGATSLTANGILLGNGTSPISSLAAGAAGQCLVSTAGAPIWTTCPGSGGVTSVNGLTGVISIANASAAGSTITINDASTSQKGIASFNSTNFTVTAGAVNTIQNINTAATPTFAGVNTNAITPSAALTVGATGQNLTLQGATTVLSATSGGNTTSLTFAAPTANVTYRLQTAAAGTYDVCTTAGNCVGTGGGVTTTGGTTNRLAKFTGSQAIGDSLLSDNGTLVTVNGNLSVTGTVSLTTALTVANGGTGATTAAGARTNLGAAASGANSDITSLSGLTTALTVLQGGTGATSLTTNGVLLGNGTSPISSLVAGSAGLCLVSTAGAPTWSACPGSGGVTSVNGQNGIISIANASGAAGVVTIDDASTSQKGIAQFNATNFSVASGIVNTIQDIATTASPTFAAINTNTITPSGAMTVGSTTQNLTLQGANTVITRTAGANTASLTFVAPTASVTYRLQTAAAGTYDVCTTAGNCTGVGGGVSTPGGTTNRLAKFTGSQTIEDSSIEDDGSLVTVNGDLQVTGVVTLDTPLAITEGGTGAVTAGAARTNLGAAASGANSDITSLSGLTTALSVTQGGTGATTLTANGVLLGNGTSAISSLAAGGAGQCLVSTAGAPIWTTCPGSGGVMSLNGQTGAVTIANASASAGTITLNDASTSQKGIAQFNSGNFSVTSGVVNTIQDINTTAAPTFGQLTLNSSQSSAAMLVVNNTNVSATGNLIDLQVNGSSKLSVNPSGDLTVAGIINGQTLTSGSANLTGTLTVAGVTTLNSGAVISGTLEVNTITPNAAMTIGATGESFVLQGNASSTIVAANGGNATTLSFQSPTASVNYRFAAAAAGNYDVCTTAGNCTGLGGGVTTLGGTTNRLAKFTGAQAIGDSLISDDGSVVTINGGDLAVYNSGNNARFIIGDSGVSGQYGYLQWDSANDYFRIEKNGSNGMKINDNFVTIGNIYPDQPLQVANGTNLLFRVDTTGKITTRTTTDSVNGFQVQDNAGDSVLNVDTLNNRVGINGIATPAVSLDVAGAIQQTGLETLNTQGTDENKWVKLGTCTIDTQYEQCLTTLNIIGGQDGTQGDFPRATVSARVKQQDALSNAPIIDLQLSGNATVITKDDMKTVTVQNDGTATVVELYGRITNEFEQWYYTPVMNTGGFGVATWVWSPEDPFQAVLPAGTQTAATYATMFATTLQATTAVSTPSIRPIVDGLAAFKLQSTDASVTALVADTYNGRIAVGGDFGPTEALDVKGALQVRDADTPTKQFRVRTNGGGLDMEAAGANLVLSTWSGANYSGTQYNQITFKSDGSNMDFARGFNVAGGHNVGMGGNVNPQYPLDVTGDINTSTQYRIGGTVICTATGCTPAAGSTDYIQNQNASSQTANFRVTGTGRADMSLQAPLFDTASAAALNIGTTNATSIALNKSTTVTGGLTQSGGAISLTGNAASSLTTSTGALTLTAAGTSNWTVGGTNQSLTVTTSGTGVLTLGTTGAGTVTLGSSSATINIGATNNARTVHIADGGSSTTQTVIMGSTNGSSSTSIQGGTGSSAIALTTGTNGKIAMSAQGTGGITANLGSAGAILQTTTNSSNALQVLDSAGLQMFNVNTSTGTIFLSAAQVDYSGFDSTIRAPFGSMTLGQSNQTTNVVGSSSSTFAGTSGSFTTTLGFTTPTGNRTISLPDASGTVCLQSSSACGFVAGTAANYIQNTTTAQSANVAVQAATSGSVAAVLQANAAGAGDILQLKNGAGTTVASVGSTGAALFKNSTNSTAAFQIQNAAASTIFNVDSTNKVFNFGSTTSTTNHATLDISSTNAVLDLGDSTNGHIYLGQYSSGLAELATDDDLHIVRSTNSTTAFQILNASDVALFNVDTTNSFVQILGTGTNGAGGEIGFGDIGNVYIGETGTTDTDAMTLHAEQGYTFETTGGQVFTLDVNGAATFGNNVNSTTAFRVLNAAGTSIFNVNTTNGNVTIRASAATYTQRLCHNQADGATTNLTLGDCQVSGQADLAEMYDTDGTVEPGDIVAPTTGRYKVTETTRAYQQSMLGIVSTNPIADGIIGYNVTSEKRQPVALVGRVPLKVSLENGPIAIGDPLTSSSTPGVAMKATGTGAIIGTALEAYDENSPRVSDQVTAEEDDRAKAHSRDLAAYRSNPSSWPSEVGKIMIFAKNSYQTDAEQMQGTKNFQEVAVQGELTAGSINVSGKVTAEELTVTGKATINELAVQKLTVAKDIAINGHIVTGGGQPKAEKADTCDVSPTISGTDTAGLVEVAIPQDCTANGQLLKVTFATPFEVAPRVTLTPANADAASAQAYVDSDAITNEKFVIATGSSVQPGKLYKWYYQVIQ